MIAVAAATWKQYIPTKDRQPAIVRGGEGWTRYSGVMLEGGSQREESCQRPQLRAGIAMTSMPFLNLTSRDLRRSTPC
jgi:hypothetical protein